MTRIFDLPFPIRAIAQTVLLGSVFVACAPVNPERAPLIAQPKTPAVKNVTSFTPALRCMDSLFATYGKRDIIITSAGLPDHTGKIKAGTRDMMISAISKMTIRSRAFRFVDYDLTQVDVLTLQNLVNKGFEAPNYYIRGAITQLDAGVASDRRGVGISTPIVSVGVNEDQIVSVISMDLNMGDMRSRQILPGIQATNSIAVSRRGKGGDVDAQVGRVGLFFNLAIDRSEGTHQSVRTLIELSLIEILGKFTRVPYWQCLQIEQTNPVIMAEASEWYYAMEDQKRISQVQVGLENGGYLASHAVGSVDSKTRSAIGRYQAENGLIANGRVTFELYYSLLGKNLIIDRSKVTTASKAGASSKKNKTQLASVKYPPIRIKLSTGRGEKPVYRVGEKLTLSLQLSQSAYTYCYYRDHSGAVARIFPNRFSSNAYVSSNQVLKIPSEQSEFELIFEKSGAVERVDCVASYREIGIGLPPAFMVEDLMPIPGKTMNDVVDQFKRIDRTGLAHSKIDLVVGG